MESIGCRTNCWSGRRGPCRPTASRWAADYRMKETTKILRYLLLAIALPGFVFVTIFFAVDYWTGDRWELYRAIQANDITTVQNILSKNKYIVYEKRNSLTPLHEAAFESNCQIAALLIKHGAKINSVGGRGHYTPLFIASNRSDFRMMKLLIENGAKIYMRDDRGKSVFDYAREDARENVLKFLNKYSERSIKR